MPSRGLAILLLVVFVSCGTTKDERAGREFTVEYSVGGGFTGIEKGVQVLGEGKAFLWERLPNSEKRNLDSLKIRSSVLDEIQELVAQPDVLNYKCSSAENYFARLNVVTGASTNNISFDPTKLPPDMPKAVRDLISVLQAIQK